MIIMLSNGRRIVVRGQITYEKISVPRKNRRIWHAVYEHNPSGIQGHKLIESKTPVRDIVYIRSGVKL